MGDIKRQGPHQVATNSTRTGRSDFKTVSENCVSWISAIPAPHVTLNRELGSTRLLLVRHGKEAKESLIKEGAKEREEEEQDEEEIVEETERSVKIGGLLYSVGEYAMFDFVV